MTFRKTLLCTLTAGALLFAGASVAQEAPVPAPPPPPAAPLPPPPPVAPAMTGATDNTATYQTPQGEVTVRSVAAPAPVFGSAPSFEQLSAGGKMITEEQAAAYPPLANDFIHADRNRDGKISAAEYKKWQQPL